MKNKIPAIPIPDFEKRLISEEEVKQLEATTVKADPQTGQSTSNIKYSYADIAKRFNVSEPSECYCPSAEDIANFYKSNPFVSIIENKGTISISEHNPDEKEFCDLPPVESMFHKLNQSVVRES
jgi:hypothetical protein